MGKIEEAVSLFEIKTDNMESCTHSPVVKRASGLLVNAGAFEDAGMFVEVIADTCDFGDQLESMIGILDDDGMPIRDIQIIGADRMEEADMYLNAILDILKEKPYIDEEILSRISGHEYVYSVHSC